MVGQVSIGSAIQLQEFFGYLAIRMVGRAAVIRILITRVCYFYELSEDLGGVHNSAAGLIAILLLFLLAYRR